MGQNISFIHLSDIHFRKYSGDKFDIDEDLRNEIIRDISRNAKSCLTNVKGILICGDIAFSGLEKEYDKAQEFLEEICDILSIPKTSVYCVPGNHDVDQSVPYRGSVLHSIQSELEKADTYVTIDSKLAGFNRDKSANNVLFKHMETYNTKFAAKFGCNINSEKPNWQIDFQLNDKNSLRLYGFNSVIVSNGEDHKDKSKDKLMILGKHQLPKREEGIIYMSLCHHPPECWKDPNAELVNTINNRVNIQLYGHKHVQEIRSINNSLIIGSGATHPSRFEVDWKPRYNWISMEIKKNDGQDYLETKIYQRVLSNHGDEFIADKEKESSEAYKEYIIKLENNTKSTIQEVMVTSTESVTIESTFKEKQSSVKKLDVDSRTIVYRFVELPYGVQTSILSKFGLIEEDYQGEKYAHIMDKIIIKAKQSGILDEFWREIKKH